MPATPAFAPATTDLCDANESRLEVGTLRILEPVFRSYGRRRRFCGPAETLLLFEDNTLVRAALEEPGAGRVLVVDGGGSKRCALLGGNLGLLAVKNGWAGVLLNGCVRDVAELEALDAGVRALGACPRKSRKRGGGARGEVVRFGGTSIEPGEWIYADEDGILVSSVQLAIG
jgi:regulator of ribonuclease activity A